MVSKKISAELRRTASGKAEGKTKVNAKVNEKMKAKGNVKAQQRRNASGEATLLFSFFNEIGIIAQLAGNEFERCLPEGLTNSQFSVLNWFARVDNEATPGRLARAFQVTGGAMTNTLKKLEGKGLIKVAPDADSGRRKKVTITSKGRALRDRAIMTTAPLLLEFAEQFPAARLEKQVKELQKIRQYLDERRYGDS